MSSPLPIASFAKAAAGSAALAVLCHFLPLGAWALVLRDSLGHIAFAYAVAALLFRFSPLGAPAAPFIDAGSPPLPAAARWLSGVTMLQIFLGALYRHGVTGFAPHLTGALLASAFLLYVATGVFTPAPAGHRCRQAAFALLWVTLAQIGLGIGAYFVKVNLDAGQPIQKGMVGLTHSHILTGALTLTMVLVLAVLLRRDVVAEAPSRT
ncbi:MAG: hypothetical protein OHK0021_20190 [Bryobacter sp.]